MFQKSFDVEYIICLETTNRYFIFPMIFKIDPYMKNLFCPYLLNNYIPIRVYRGVIDGF